MSAPPPLPASAYTGYAPVVMDPHEQLFRMMYEDRRLAHKVLFAHRHPAADPLFHDEMIPRFHSEEEWSVMMAFRGGAKTTVAEEAICIMAGFREFKNCLIIGKTADRAMERLETIRHEFESNDSFIEVFGELKGSSWGDEQLITSKDVKISARGRGQPLRGIKHHDMRPDFWLFDDPQEREDVATPDARTKLLRWTKTSLLPACDPGARGRITATPLDPEDLVSSLAREPLWSVYRWPIKFRDKETGAWRATWPERHPLLEVEAEALRAAAAARHEPKPAIKSVQSIEESFALHGMTQEFNAEYMCEAETAELKPFKREMFKSDPVVKTWQATYAFFDPARTVNAKSATTGFACWSWLGARLHIWDSWGKMLMPDQLIDALFTVDAEHRPVEIGVEEDGLNEWLMQPIRIAQVQRGVQLPVKAHKAPRGKLDFIRALQPYFAAGEVTFGKPMPDLEQQLRQFPTGRIDTPNALAFALKMRPGSPIYDSFGVRHIADQLQIMPGQKTWLAVNATGNMTTGVLLQHVNGALRIYADIVREGEPGEVIGDMISWANLEAGRKVEVVAHPKHWETYTNVGLIQGVKTAVHEVRKGVPAVQGREWMRHLMQVEKRNQPALVIAADARWTLNALAGGYMRMLRKGGAVGDEAEDGAYKTLMEGVEAFVGLLKVGSPDDSEDVTNWGVGTNGQRYRSALPQRRPMR